MNKLHYLYRAAAVVGLALSLGTVASIAEAHAKVESTTPVADASVSSPKLIQVHFNEAVETKMSSIKLAASDGTAVPIMSMNDAKDPATLTIMPNAPLKAGLYKVMWSAVTDDGHKTQGAFSFTVKWHRGGRGTYRRPGSSVRGCVGHFWYSAVFSVRDARLNEA